MSTSAVYTNIESKKLMGTIDFGERMLAHMRELVRENSERVWDEDVVHGSQLTLAADGANKFKVTGTALASDGDGRILDIANAAVNSAIQFENVVSIPYYVGLKYAEIPSGSRINTRSGWPEYEGWKEEIGESGAPDSVTNLGSTLRMVVDGVTEAGVSNAGRKVLVFKNSPGKNAITDAIAIEECTVVWSGGQNIIETTAQFGQDTVSTTAADYTVVLLGPVVKRNTDLRLQSGIAFLGIITGAGAGTPPSVFDHTDQEITVASLSKLHHITRVASNGRLKIDVKPIAGETNEKQIISRDPSGTIKFWVDEEGNVKIEGDLEVTGTTTQHDLVQVNSSETITDNLTAGDDDATDSHLIKGTWRHTNNAETANYFKVDGSTGRVGIWADPTVADRALLVGGISQFNYQTIVNSTAPARWYRETDQSVNAGGLWRSIVSGALFGIDENTAAGGDFTSYRRWIDFNRTSSVMTTFGHHVPSADDSYDLGGPSQEWQDLYLDGTAYVDKLNLSTAAGEGLATNMVPTADSALNIGSASYRFSKMYARTIELDGTAGYGVSSDLTPTADNTYNIGSASRRWANIYVYTLNFTGDFLPQLDDTQDIGNPSYRWAEGYINDLWLATAAGRGVHTSIMPSADDTLDLGSASYMWSNAHIHDLYLDTAAGRGVQTDVVPGADGSYNIGDPSYRWNDVFCNTMYIENTNDYTTLSALMNTTETSDPVEPNRIGVSITSTSGNATFKALTSQLTSNAGTATSGATAINSNVYTSLANTTSSAWSEVYGTRISTAIGTGHTVNDWYGTYISMPTGGGSATDLFGLHISQLSAFTAANKFGIYIGAITGGSTLNLGIYSASEVQFDATLTSRDIIPGSNNVYDLGSATRIWTQAHINTATIYSSIIPYDDDAQTMGSASYRWSELYLYDLRIYGNVVGSLTPSAHNTYNLGSISNQWAALWVANLLTTNNLQVDGRISSNLLPLNDDSYDLGSTTYEWRNLYIDGTANIDAAEIDSTNIVTGAATYWKCGATTPQVTYPLYVYASNYEPALYVHSTDSTDARIAIGNTGSGDAEISFTAAYNFCIGVNQATDIFRICHSTDTGTNAFWFANGTGEIVHYAATNDVGAGGLAVRATSGAVQTWQSGDTYHPFYNKWSNRYAFLVLREVYDSDVGGAEFIALSESYQCVVWTCGVNWNDTATNSSAHGAFRISVGIDNGAGSFTTPSADGNAFTVGQQTADSTSTTVLTIKCDGDIYNDTAVYGSYDVEQDALACRDLAYVASQRFDKVMKYHAPELERLGVMKNGFMSTNKFRALTLGAVGELWEVVNYLCEKIGVDYETIRKSIRSPLDA